MLDFKILVVTVVVTVLVKVLACGRALVNLNGDNSMCWFAIWLLAAQKKYWW